MSPAGIWCSFSVSGNPLSALCVSVGDERSWDSDGAQFLLASCEIQACHCSFHITS